MTFFLHSTSARLACLRQELGLSHETLSALMGVSYETVMSWEQGDAEVPESVWDRISQLRCNQPRRAGDRSSPVAAFSAGARTNA